LARILCVDDEEFWREYIKRQLPDHDVYVASSFDKAVDLLRSEPTYDVALVDLNLRNDGDGEGGELFELLLLRYPTTKRIAVTATPPGGAMKPLITRYGLQEFIIKDKISVPGLRRAVEEAVTATPAEISRELRLRKWDLRDRFRDWQRIESDRMQKELTAAEGHLSDVRRMRGNVRQEAQEAIVSIRVRQERFREAAERLREIVNNINSEADFDAALTALENAEEQFSGDGTEPSR
jgi:CheY-like chemotaxis protein